MDIAPLEELTAKTLAAPTHLFDVRRPSLQAAPGGATGARAIRGAESPYGAVIW